ncbi:hypothetical protein MPTK1_8g15010 [Marchantia polymorpha subsp. ruderalis]|uniref:Uncharacterized protein n=1 Tax=Marchantia polymorpha TaxID=3197 RepID=A0A2R6W4Z4_MARPO|nr:hypothetical protein MARPO_0151s0005 [Marchantia polymorpha]BBN19936.1 hypothetical protein Mp_8g15010 [Marchantia polymorpha subsp. ruderalis]|eukprot:PTQ28928.1 hypothetical protein MARPO_0151s0005 [Marchantia polymorpha]
MATAAAAAATCAVSAISASSLSSAKKGSENLVSCFHGQSLSLQLSRRSSVKSFGSRPRRSSISCAAKLPKGVEAPKEEPKLPTSFWGFTENAEVWNARASMIGLFGIILLELFAKKGLLEMIGVEVGKGLDLPL